jgi:hypothetical protein
LALTLWNLTSRSPVRVAQDIFHSFARPLTFAGGALRFVAGLVFAAFALALVLSALRFSTAEVFSIFAVITFLTALVVESLIGDDLRRIFGR